MKNLILLLCYTLGLLFFAACNNVEETAIATATKTYTCPMHPQVVQNKPGTCPICGMDLVAFDKNSETDYLTLGASQRALGNISTTIIDTQSVYDQVRLNGRLATNPAATFFVAARIPGRIEELLVRETGVQVKKRQPLYRLYSEELAALQQEFLVTHAQQNAFPDNQQFRQIAKAARQKLILYGQTEGQLTQLINTSKALPLTTFFAPADGFVAAVSVTEGQYVSEGATIMQLEDYNNLWVEADLYPSEAARLKTGQQVKVIVSGFENEPQNMQIDFISPALQAGSQLRQLRGSIKNTGHWQVGQNAIVLLPLKEGKQQQIALPIDAIIRDGKGAHVWVVSDSNHYSPRHVVLGEETPEKVVIREGLHEGEQVVVTGAYLLYSEYVLKKGNIPAHHH